MWEIELREADTGYNFDVIDLDHCPIPGEYFTFDGDEFHCTSVLSVDKKTKCAIIEFEFEWE